MLTRLFPTKPDRPPEQSSSKSTTATAAAASSSKVPADTGGALKIRPDANKPTLASTDTIVRPDLSMVTFPLCLFISAYNEAGGLRENPASKRVPAPNLSTRLKVWRELHTTFWNIPGQCFPSGVAATRTRTDLTVPSCGMVPIHSHRHSPSLTKGGNLASDFG